MENAIAKKCANCGGELTFNPNIAAQKCAYCGSEFKPVDKEGNVVEGLSMVPFKIDRARFKKDMLQWIASGDFAPANILSFSAFGNMQQCYVPVYYVKGAVSGQWTSYLKPGTGVKKYLPKALKGQRSKLGDGTINESFTAVVPASDSYKSAFLLPEKFYKQYYEETGKIYSPSEDNHPLFGLLESYNINEKDVIAADQKRLDDVSSQKFDLNKDEAWDRFGEKQVSKNLCKKIAAQQQNAQDIEVTINADYQIASAGKLYLPIWMIKNLYNNNEYNICMDGVTGTISGERIEDTVSRPSKKKTLRFCVLIGLGLSLAWYIRLFSIPNAFQYVSQRNNFLYSPMGSFWWFVRVLLLWVAVPALLFRFFYAKALERLKMRLQTERQNELEAINSGSLELKHWDGKKGSRSVTDVDEENDDDSIGNEPWTEKDEDDFQESMKRAKKWGLTN